MQFPDRRMRSTFSKENQHDGCFVISANNKIIPTVYEFGCYQKSFLIYLEV